MSISNDIRNSSNLLYGAWKYIQEINLEDMLPNPVWVWCLEVDEDGVPPNGDETSIRPALESREVPLDHIAPPLILLQVKGTNYYASGLYYHDREELESISLFVEGAIVSPDNVVDLPNLAIYCSIPSIEGQKGIEFITLDTDSDHAKRTRNK